MSTSKCYTHIYCVSVIKRLKGMFMLADVLFVNIYA